MATALAILLAAGLLGAAFLFLSSGRRTARARSAQAPQTGPAAVGPGGCALCGSALKGGERLKSDMGPGSGDRMMRIFGCPHCWPGLSEADRVYAARYCPVCRSRIPDEGWAIARYFERPGRRHVHILGCTVCRPHAS
ncbi:MAG TPA: hypothetical protein VFL04_04600 [Rectinemataceae bacterium]|nr:hypothetical protein [Rectinemataceae bacterium]